MIKEPEVIEQKEQEWVYLDKNGKEFTPSANQQWCAIWDKKHHLVWAEPSNIKGVSVPSNTEQKLNDKAFEKLETERLIRHMNTVNACGINDWSIPTEDQAKSIRWLRVEQGAWLEYQAIGVAKFWGTSVVDELASIKQNTQDII